MTHDITAAQSFSENSLSVETVCLFWWQMKVLLFSVGGYNIVSISKTIYCSLSSLVYIIFQQENKKTLLFQFGHWLESFADLNLNKKLKQKSFKEYVTEEVPSITWLGQIYLFNWSVISFCNYLVFTLNFSRQHFFKNKGKKIIIIKESQPLHLLLWLL